MTPQSGAVLAGFAALGDGNERRRKEVSSVVVGARRPGPITVLQVPVRPGFEALPGAGQQGCVDAWRIVEPVVRECGIGTVRAHRVTAVPPRGAVTALAVADDLQVVEQCAEVSQRRSRGTLAARCLPCHQARLQVLRPVETHIAVAAERLRRGPDFPTAHDCRRHDRAALPPEFAQAGQRLRVHEEPRVSIRRLGRRGACVQRHQHLSEQCRQEPEHCVPHY